MGPIGGGLASGIGAMLYDLTNPAYIASAPFTFVFKFLLAAVCGLIAHKGKITGNMLEEDFTITVPRSIVAGICGSLTYIVLYLAKSYITTVLAGSAPEAAAIALATKAASSTVNAILAIIISVPLSALIRKALKSAHLTTKYNQRIRKAAGTRTGGFRCFCVTEISCFFHETVHCTSHELHRTPK